MSFDDFVQQMNIIQQQNPGFFSSLFQNIFFAIGICCLFITFSSCIIISRLSSKYASRNFVLRFFVRILSIEGFISFFYIVPVALMIIASFYVGKHYKDVLKPQQEQVYLNYMEGQPLIKQPLETLIWKPEEVADASSIHSSKQIDDYEYKKSYRFDWVSCENCELQTVFYKVKKTDKNYTKMDVFVSYSLPDGQTPYLLTKVPLRKSVYNYSSEALLNPIIYLPKSDWGFAK